MKKLLKSIIILLTILATIEAAPECEKSNLNIVCTAGDEDYLLVRGLVSDNDQTTNITLKSCRIIDVEYESFNDLISLKFLDLSLNKISNLKLGVLDEPKQLTYLNLSHNLLTEFPLGLFDQITNLAVLDLKGNKIRNLELGIFDLLKKLKHVDLSNNALQGKNLNAYVFDQSPRITFIDYSGNDMTDAPDNLLHAFLSLKELNLNGDLLKEVPAFATKPNMKTLKHLSMTNNQIKTLNNPAIFTNLVNLKLLDLSFNRIEDIHGDVFANLKNLQKISLKNNRIKIIPDNLFRNLPSLMSVQLLANQISDVPVNAFRGTALKYLNISNNKITYLVDNFCLELQNSGAKLKALLFNPNPWQCACLTDLLKELKRLGIEYDGSKYNGNNRVCVTTNEFYCNRHQRFNDIYIDLYKNSG